MGKKPTRMEFLRTASAAAAAPTLVAQTTPQTQAPPTRTVPADLGSRHPDLQALSDRNNFQLSFLGPRFNSLGAFEAEARKAVFDALLYRPDPVSPEPEVLETVDCGDYIRRRITFRTTPLFRVPAYVLIPKGLKAKAPAIVDLHSHGGMFLFGKEKVIDLDAGGSRNHPAMVGYHAENYESRPTATALVKRGYVVISIDAFGFGERRVILDEDLPAAANRDSLSVEEVRRLNRKCAAKESTLVKSLTFAGATWPGVVFWDDIRTVDYLSSLPEVDPERIGCLGVSMGGYRTLYLAALDPRIKAACLAGFMSTIKPMLRSYVDRHSFVHYLPGLHQNLDFPDVATLTAPRALMVLQCSRDGLFPLDGMRESVRNIAAGYQKAGIPEKFSGRFYDHTHIFSVNMQQDAFAWLDHHLRER